MGLVGPGEPGPGHQACPHLSRVLQSASLSSRLISSASWGAWKGSEASRVLAHERVRQAVVGPAHQERQDRSSLGGACILWWHQGIQRSPHKRQARSWRHMDLIVWGKSAWGAWGRGAGVEQLIGLKIA